MKLTQRLKNIKYVLIDSLIYKYQFKHIGECCFIDKRASIQNKKNMVLGDYVKIELGCVIWGINVDIGNNTKLNPYTIIYGNVKLGAYNMISPCVKLMGGGHGFKDTSLPMKSQEYTDKGGIIVGDDVWIGTNSVILDGVKIGKGAIVGANSLVCNNVAPMDIVAGSPARKISNRVHENNKS